MAMVNEVKIDSWRMKRTMKFTITAADLRDPSKSSSTAIRVEDAAHCDGIVCNQQGFVYDELGECEAVLPAPHHHLVVSGKDPDASPRYYPI